MAANERVSCSYLSLIGGKLFLLVSFVVIACILCRICPVYAAKRSDSSGSFLADVADIRDFRKLLRTKTNVLVLYAKSDKDADKALKVFRSVAETIRGEGTLLYVNCGSEAKKLCKKLKISPEPTVFKHYKDGEFHKDYDRRETIQSMVTFMRNPTGDIPWEEDETSTDVVHVADAHILEKLLTKQTRPVLVMFYAPWCGFCKKLKPDYSLAATEVKKIAILSAMDVNKPENLGIRNHFNITGFPTILYFEGGQMKHIYDGENNREGIVSFIKNPSRPKPEKPKETEWHEVPSDVVHLTDSTFDVIIAKENSVLVMFYAPWCGHCKSMKPEYEEAAAKLKLVQTRGILAAVDATKEQNVASKFSIKGYPSVKYFSDGEFAFDVSYRTADKLIEFMNDPKEPPPPPPPETPWSETESSVWHLNDDNFKPFLKKKKHAIVMFYAPWCGHCKRAKPEFESAASKFQEDVQVAFAAVDCTSHNAVCSTYNVNGFPTIKYFSYLKNVSDYDGERTENSFVSFMKNPQTPSKRKIVSAEETFAGIAGAENLKHLMDATFPDFLSNQESAIVMFYAPWCGHCNTLKPIFAKAAERAKTEKLNVVFATVDATTELQLKQTYDIKGFPTVKYFRFGKFVTDYDRQRTVDDFVQFVSHLPRDEL